MEPAYYRKVEEPYVEPEKLAAAEAALKRARAELCLPEIGIRWVRMISRHEYETFDRLAEIGRKAKELKAIVAGRLDFSGKDSPASVDEDGAFLGQVSPFGAMLGAGKGWRKPEILVNVDQAIGELEFTVFHEAKHLADYRSGLFDYGTPAGRRESERSADQFADRMIRSKPR